MKIEHLQCPKNSSLCGGYHSEHSRILALKELLLCYLISYQVVMR